MSFSGISAGTPWAPRCAGIPYYLSVFRDFLSAKVDPPQTSPLLAQTARPFTPDLYAESEEVHPNATCCQFILQPHHRVTLDSNSTCNRISKKQTPSFFLLSFNYSISRKLSLNWTPTNPSSSPDLQHPVQTDPKGSRRVSAKRSVPEHLQNHSARPKFQSTHPTAALQSAISSSH